MAGRSQSSLHEFVRERDPDDVEQVLLGTARIELEMFDDNPTLPLCGHEQQDFILMRM